MMVVMMTSLLAADCSTFLPLRREKLDRQWFGDGSVNRLGEIRSRSNELLFFSRPRCHLLWSMLHNLPMQTGPTIEWVLFIDGEC